ncbi:hypothetical protein SAMN05444272_1399 [Roseibium suaedae]|uniref:Uncharacterized protein n=1 Tax=Roseibium suaedae TaxID=735517 RepID=A0A1M7D864_9HYPH|nr:hypothetical protein SAMN05444272_1399 [Roseibium suaedae]
MGCNKCRDCSLSNRMLLDFCMLVDDEVADKARKALELSVYAEAIGATEAAAKFRTIGMLLGRARLINDLLEREKLRAKRPRLPTRRT